LSLSGYALVVDEGEGKRVDVLDGGNALLVAVFEPTPAGTADLGNSADAADRRKGVRGNSTALAVLGAVDGVDEKVDGKVDVDVEAEAAAAAGEGMRVWRYRWRGTSSAAVRAQKCCRSSCDASRSARTE